MSANPSRTRGRIGWGSIVAIVVTLVSCAAPAGAAAETLTPSLAGTYPSSPGTSTTPRIYGTLSEIITTSIGEPVLSPAGVGEGPIDIYAEPGCAGPVVTSGSGPELENSGIPVTVGLGTTTTFSARNTENGVPSECSNDIVYRQVTEPPAMPVIASVSPASPANDNFPSVHGSADADSTVFLYANASCSGAPLASGSATQFGEGGIVVPVADNTTTTFYAKAAWAEIPSPCSSTSVTYQEVTPPPASGGGGAGGGTTDPPVTGAPLVDPPGKPSPPQLRTVPGRIANNLTPVVIGSAPGASSVKIFGSSDCKPPLLAKAPASALAAGIPVQVAPNSTVTFYGRSVDGGGDESACSSAPAIYTDDSIAPRTRITAGPGAKTVKPTVVFRFADVTAGPLTSFLCKLDSKRWKPCAPPLRLKHLGRKRHLLRVKAYDAAGNREKTGAKRSFQVISAH